MTKKKTDKDLETENKQLREQLRQSVHVVEGLNVRVKALESQDRPLEVHDGPPSWPIYGTDENGRNYDGMSLNMDSRGRPIFKANPKPESEADRLLREFAEDRKKTNELLERSKNLIEYVKIAHKTHLDEGERLGKLKRNRGLSVGGYNSETKKWELEEEPETPEKKAMDNTIKPLAGAKWEPAKPIEKFEGSKSSEYMQDIQKWKGGNRQPVDNQLTVGSYDRDSKEWKTGQEKNAKIESDVFVGSSQTQYMSPPGQKCPQDVPRMLMGIYELSCTGCPYQSWCLEVRKSWGNSEE